MTGQSQWGPAAAHRLVRDHHRHLIVMSPEEFGADRFRTALAEFGPSSIAEFKIGDWHLCALHLRNREYTVAHAVEAAHRQLPQGHPFTFGGNPRLRMHSERMADPLYPQQWAWENIAAEAAWSRFDQVRRSHDLALATVAIVDWGIKADHQDLDRRRIVGHRVIPPDNGDCDDDDGHGTMLAGTIAARRGNHFGVVGTVPTAQLMAVKFIDVRTPPMALYAAMAIACAVDNGAKIINASWDVGIDAPVLRRALEYADSKDVLVVAAAGNDGSDNARYLTYPADYRFKNVMSVMATDQRDQKPGFSNYGGTVDLGAPGVDIYSTSPYLVDPGRRPSRFCNPAYRLYSGTSPAAAHVSGAAALLLSIDDRWKPAEIREHLRASADHVPGLERFAVGRLDLRRAVEGPFAIAISRKDGDLIVEWSCDYQSPAVKSARLWLVDGDDPNRARLLADGLATSGRCRFGLADLGAGPQAGGPIAGAFVRVECCEKRLYTDSPTLGAAESEAARAA